MERIALGSLTALIGDRDGRYPSANSMLVEDDVTLIVDPSIDVVAAREEASRWPVDIVVNSHAHEDHFAGNFLFGDAELILHEIDAPAMQSMENLLALYGMGGEIDELWAQIVVDEFNYAPRADVRRVGDGDTLDLGRTTVRFLHMPGHTGGHMCLLFEPQGVVFTGDLDLSRFGPYYADAGASLDDTIRSLERLRDLEGITAFVSSHEAAVVSEDLPGHVQRYMDVLWRREATLLQFVAEPRTMDEIARRCIVYGKKYDHIAWQHHAETVMMRQHVERLAALGRIVVDDDLIVAV